MLPLAICLLAACGQSAPPELEQGAAVVGYMLRPSNLSRSAFCAAFPDGKPSQFVSYMFSQMGSAEWPPSEAWADPAEREQMRAIRAPMIPADVTLVPRKPDPKQKKQIVVRADDERAMVVCDGYLDPKSEPVASWEWALPKVKPAPGIQEMYRSNAELGMSNQAF
jgi:hypothetical protein